MDKLRLEFCKTGRAVYISHLDLMRTMQRSFLRAGYPLSYSGGFNPHAQISILMPLSVGCASECELMDFNLVSETDTDGMADRLTAAMPEGLRAVRVYPAVRKCAEIKWLRVAGRFEYDARDTEEAAAHLREFFRRDAIFVRKKTKRGETDMDIAAAIKSIDFTAGDKTVAAEAVVSAQFPTLNPDYLTAALRALEPETAPDFAEFTRLRFYDADMEIFE